MTAQLPDILPLAHIRAVGIPFHGLVADSVLTLPDNSTMAYPQLYYGQTNYVKHPLANAPTRSAYEQALDTANNYQWLDYAMLSGAYCNIGGQNLGARHWLYCDDENAWDVYLKVEKAGTYDLLATLKLKRLFGRLPVDGADLSMTERTLATLQWTVTDCAGATITADTYALWDGMNLFTANQTGSVSLHNLYLRRVGTGSWPGGLTAPVSPNYGYMGNPLRLHNVLRVTLAGNGAVTPGNVGAGITGSIGMEVVAADTWYPQNTNNSTVDDWSCVATDDGGGGVILYNGKTSATYDETETVTEWVKSQYVVLPDGTTTNLTYTVETQTVKDYDCSISGGISGSYSISYSSVATTTYTVSFGGSTVTLTKTYSLSAGDSGSYTFVGDDLYFCLDFPVSYYDSAVCTVDGSPLDCDDWMTTGMLATIDSNNLVYANSLSPQLIAADGTKASVSAGATGTWCPIRGIEWSTTQSVCWV